MQEETFLTNQFGDNYLFSINREDFNRLGSQVVFEDRLSNNLFEEHHLYFIIGSDSGLLPRYIKDKGVPNGSRYVFIEPQPILDKVLPLCDELDERFLFTTPNNPIEAIDENSDLGAAYYTYHDDVTIEQSLAARHDYLEVYAQLPILLKEKIEAYSYQVKGGINLRSHYINQIVNSVDAVTPAVFLKGLFKDRSCVILAGGPSLDDGLQWLKQHRSNVVVIAVSRICRRLIDIDIQPDIVVSTDPTILSFEISRELIRMEGPLFAHQPTTHPMLAGQWGGMKTHFGVRLPWPSDLNDENMFLSGGNTISNLAVDLAHYMGSRQIILFGVDLCHSQDGHTHAKGSNERKYPPPIHLNILDVETNSGEKATSTPDLFKSAKSIGVQAKRLTDDGFRVINPAPGAAKIDYVDHTPLTEITIEPVDGTSLDRIKDNFPDSDKEAYWDDLAETYQSAIKDIDHLERLSKRCVKVLTRVEEEKKSRKNPFTLVEKIRTKLDENPLGAATRHIHWPIFTKISLILESSEEEDKKRAVQANKAYFEAFIEAAVGMREIVEDALARLTARREEEKEDADLSLLIEQWRKDSQTGRHQIWLKKHPDAYDRLSKKDQEEFQALQDEFEELMTTEDTTHEKRAKSHTDVRISYPCTTTLFMHQSQDGLKRLITILEQYPEEDAKDYLAFTQGMLHELEQNTLEAFNAYQEILQNPQSPLAEQALKRITALCLEIQDFENAAFAIEGLVHISSKYLPDYADILDISGYANEALDTYRHYVSENPNDIAALTKLAQMAIRQGHQQEAKEVATNILEKTPESAAAKQILDQLEQ